MKPPRSHQPVAPRPAPQQITLPPLAPEPEPARTLPPPLGPLRTSLEMLEAQVAEMKSMQQALLEARQLLHRETRDRERFEAQAQREKERADAAEEELDRVAQDAILPRSCEIPLAQRTGTLTWEMTPDGKVRVIGNCRGRGHTIGKSAAEVVSKLLT